MSQYRFFLRGLVAFGFLALLPSVVPAGTSSAELATDTLKLQWVFPTDGSPEQWLLNTVPEAGFSAGRSLINRDASGRRLSQHLRLVGVDFEDDAWQLVPGRNGRLVLEARSADGALHFVKSIEPDPERPWRLDVVIQIENHSDSELNWSGGQPGIRIGPGVGEEPVEGLGIAEAMYSYVEPVARKNGELMRLGLDDAGETKGASIEGSADWLGLHSRYFALLLVPSQGTIITRAEAVLPTPEVSGDVPSRLLPSLTITPETRELAAGQSLRWQFQVFSGPKAKDALASDRKASDFSNLLFPGLWEWMRALSFGLLWLLAAIHGLIPSWGLAIIVLAVLVRVLMYPIAQKAMNSQQKFSEVQQLIQPEIRKIKRQFKGEEQSERILALYQEYGVSPLAGLKPLLIVAIQIPIFVALFHLLGQAYELRDASFLWIETLAEPDRLFPFGVDLPFFGAHLNVLPFLMALTTLLTIRLAPSPAADRASRRRQNYFLVAMAIGFLVLFYPFPSGMVLYWTVANMLHLLQHALIVQRRT